MYGWQQVGFGLGGVSGHPKLKLNLKPEPAPNFYSGENSSPKSKPADTRNSMNNPKPEIC